MQFLAKRKIRKNARELLHHARHLRHLREDIMPPGQLQRLDELMQALKRALGGHADEGVKAAAHELDRHMASVAPAPAHASLRENLEIIVVAIAVAMGVRSYFLQPFKIPTGSMQPTLYGIHSSAPVKPGLIDHYPLKLIKWVVTGDWYKRVKASTSGYLAPSPHTGAFFDRHPTDPSSAFCYIGGVPHKVPLDAPGKMQVELGKFVDKGTVIWAGARHAGDHVFVDKVSWNFRRPRRGEIVVFTTEGIPSLPQGTHYIKRMVGLPGESVAVHEPWLLIDDKPVDRPEQIARICRQETARNGQRYDGYRTIGGAEADSRQPLRSLDDHFELLSGEYFAMGDNTTNSRDSRYWGAVPEKNLVGPALLVYWPLTRRWGLAD